jgi:putative ABC transport system permease protein
MSRRNPGFTAIAVLTLALGVGSSTAIFSVVKAVLLNPLPYRNPDRVVALTQVDSATGAADGPSGWTRNELRTRARSFESISQYGDAQRTLIENGEAEVLRGTRVNYDFFATLGVKMFRGRTFFATEDRWPRGDVVILTHGLWRRRFNEDPGVIGRTLSLGGESYQVIGVLPPDFHPLRMSNPAEKPEIFMPAGYNPAAFNACRSCFGTTAIARLKAGVNLDAARAEVDSIMRDLAREYPADFARYTARLEPLQDRLVGPIQVALWVLLGAVGFVLLIACANIANLLLARATARSKEIVLRAALGCSRGRLTAQLLTESLLLSVTGGIVGVFAWQGTSALASLAPKELPRLDEIRLDAPVLLFGLAVSVITGLAVGVIPAWRSSQPAAPAGSRLRNLLVISEVALAFVLAVGAGLLGKSFLRLTAVDPGFNPHHVLTMTPTLAGKPYETHDATLRYYRQVVERVRAVPGILSAGMVTNVPLSHTEPVVFRIDGRPAVRDSEAPLCDMYMASPGYFRVLEIPLKRGRFFTDEDAVSAPPVMLVSESFARLRFPDSDPLGRRIKLGLQSENEPWAEIVGIVGDVRQTGFDSEPNQSVYLPQAVHPFHYSRLVARTAGAPMRFERAVRAAIREIDPTQPVFHVQPMDDYVSSSLADRTFMLALISLFGTLALLLAGIGIYGVISYTVDLRTREVGIRVALGAGRRTILRMVFQDVLILLAWGFAAGLLAAFALTRFLSHLLFEVRPTDVATSASVVLLLSSVALFASYLPARRAASIDPALALRSE